MFGNESKPSKIYSYGGLAPVENLDAVVDQMRAGHEFRNALVALERTRRDHYHQILAQSRPEIARLVADIAEMDKQIDTLRTEAKRQHSDRRKRTTSDDLKAGIHSAIDTLKMLRPRLKQLCTAARDDLSVRSQLEQMEARHRDDEKRLYAENRAAWGTKLAVMQSASDFKKGPPPQFKRWEGEGRIAVQIQKGMGIDEVTLGDDTRFRIVLTGQSGRGGRPYAQAWLRIGTNGREPIWAVMPIVYHRPLPPDSRVKWVYLHRYTCGTRNIWKLSIVVSRDQWEIEDAATDGEVAIAVGWKKVDGLLVASWAGSDGATGELILPADELKRWSEPNDRRAIRDHSFNVVRDQVAEFLASVTPAEELTEAAKFLTQWRSPGKLARLLQVWRDHRIAGDEEVFADLEKWNRSDRREWNSEAGQRERAGRWRDNRYRNFVAELRRRYHTAIVREVDYAGLAKLPLPEEDGHVVGEVRWNQRVASPGRLVALIQEGFADCEKVRAAKKAAPARKVQSVPKKRVAKLA